MGRRAGELPEVGNAAGLPFLWPNEPAAARSAWQTVLKSRPADFGWMGNQANRFLEQGNLEFPRPFSQNAAYSNS
jgi:hypothetical protein